MRPAAYKAACAPPHVMPRPVLERTAAVLRARAPREALRVRTQLWAPVVPKPPRHRGGAHTDHLRVTLEPVVVADVVVAILAELLRCEVEGEAHRHERARLLELLEPWEDWWLELGMPEASEG